MNVINPKGPSIEFASESEVKQLQEEKINALFTRLKLHSKYYQEKIKESNLWDVDEYGISELKKMPFTTKDDLSNHNNDFLCIPINQVADFVTTSGTTGDPVTFYLSQSDLDRLAYNEAISMQCAGANSNDIFQLITTIDKRFMAGIAYFLGTQKLGAGIVRNGPGSAQFQWDSIQRFNPTILIAIPSFIPQMLEYAKNNGINPNETSVKKIICIGEPLRNQEFDLNDLGKEIRKHWNIELFSTYASTEMGAAFTECEAGNGGHHHPELLYLEVLTEDGEEAKNGEEGEVVVTTLGVEGLPLVRYRTGDICKVYTEKCSCGRTSKRLGPVVGRKNQMLKYKGTTLFPQVIFDVLDGLEEVKHYILEVTKTEFGTDDLAVLISEEIESITFKEKVISKLRAKLRVVPKVKFIPNSELLNIKFNPNSRKPIKFLDLR